MLALRRCRVRACLFLLSLTFQLAQLAFVLIAHCVGGEPRMGYVVRLLFASL